MYDKRLIFEVELFIFEFFKDMLRSRSLDLETPQSCILFVSLSRGMLTRLMVAPIAVLTTN